MIERAHWRALVAATLLLLACAVPVGAATHVHIVATGGTIANAPGGRLTPGQLIAALPDRRRLGTIESETFSNASSASLALEDWVRLARRVAAIFDADATLDGVVVTSGTDTLEELAWFLHLTVSDSRPVVVVGAMRRPDAPDADGPRNMADAVRVAGSPAARRRGTLVVMHGQVHAAVEVRKLHATELGAFDSPAAQVLGTVAAGRVRFFRPPAPRPAPGQLVPHGDDALPRVDVLLTYQGATGDLLEVAVVAGARGLVIASAGAGALTPSQAEAARRLAERGVPVVISSRTGAGPVRVFDPLDDEVLSSGDLPALKARLLLMLALAGGADAKRIAALFAEASAR